MSVTPNIGPIGWAFLLLAGVLLPIATTIFALAERRSLVESGSNDPTAGIGPTRMAMYAQTLVTHALLFGGTIAVARAERLQLPFSLEIDLGDVVAAATALVSALLLAELYWRSRSPADREGLWIRRILPHTATERRTWVLLSASAAIAEETAYRGAFVGLASAATGSLLAGIVASAIAFALVHAPQGVAGVRYVFLIALVHQALVLLTGTLLLAIVVHFAYDVLAGLWLARKHGLTDS